MPAKDFYHDTVVRALSTAGWIVSPKQYRIDLPERKLWIDIFATRSSDRITVEIKGFENIPSPVDYLQAALGQYLLYRAIIRSQNSNIPLYMAVPQAAFHGIFEESIGQIALKELDVWLIVFDPIREKVVKWIP